MWDWSPGSLSGNQKWPVDSITAGTMSFQILRELISGYADSTDMWPRGRSGWIMQRSVTDTTRVCLKRDTNETEPLPLYTEMEYAGRACVRQKEARPTEWKVEDSGITSRFGAVQI